MHGNAIATFYHLYAVDEESLTTTDLAKMVFEPEGTSEVRNADRKVRHYLEDTYPHLVSVEEEDGTKRFTLRDARVWFGLGKMHVVTPEEDEVVTGFGDVMVYEDEEGHPNVVSLQYEADIDVDTGE